MPKTGATRYQKFLKSEKAKTKLKAKKDLPIGTNVTKVNFKTKKIVIKEQLKKHSEHEALSKRKLNIKELLSRLNHFNTNSRKDALYGLKDLIITNPEVLEQNLGQLIHGVTPMILNIEKSVRQETLKVLHLILSNVSLDKIEPFYDVMSTYLRSGMTHIDSRIQEDSLLFLDILLLCTSNKVSFDFHKIMPNFLDMVSKLRVDAKPGRTLTVNLDSQVTSVQWRVKVLYRLKKFLQKFIELNNINHVNKNIVDTNHKFDKTKFNHYSLLNPTYTSLCFVSCFSGKSSLDTMQLDEIERFQTYIDTLMPLLFETWLEVRPNKESDKNFETVINEDAALLLRHTLQVISLIWHLIEYLNKKNSNSNVEKRFCEKYRQPFGQHFLSMFPYVTNKRSRQAATDNVTDEDVITDSKMTIENLETCYLFITLNPFVNIQNQKKEISSVLNYIEKIFNQTVNDNVSDVVMKILNRIFAENVTNWTRNLSIMDALFRKIIWTYFNKTIADKFRQNIFALLCKVSLNQKFEQFHSSDAFEKWLENLPDILLECSVSEQTIYITHKFAIAKNKTFNNVIKPKLFHIISNLPNIKISDCTNYSNTYYKLLSLLYWINNWDEKSINLLEKQLLDNVYKDDHRQYIMDTLKLKTGVEFEC